VFCVWEETLSAWCGLSVQFGVLGLRLGAALCLRAHLWADTRMTSVEHIGMLQMPRYHTRRLAGWQAGLGWGLGFSRENQALATRTGDAQVLTQEWTSDCDCPSWTCIFSCNRHMQGTSTCWVPPAHRPIAIVITIIAREDLHSPSLFPVHTLPAP
jgi:hypothetical protein